jgi:hypothetical protein
LSFSSYQRFEETFKKSVVVLFEETLSSAAAGSNLHDLLVPLPKLQRPDNYMKVLEDNYMKVFDENSRAGILISLEFS